MWIQVISQMHNHEKMTLFVINALNENISVTSELVKTLWLVDGVWTRPVSQLCQCDTLTKLRQTSKTSINRRRNKVIICSDSSWKHTNQWARMSFFSLSLPTLHAHNGHTTLNHVSMTLASYSDACLWSSAHSGCFFIVRFK